MALNGIEEVILLKAVKEFIDSMVNFEMLQIYGSDPDSNILFNTSTLQRLFNVILVDFLSRRTEVVHQTDALHWSTEADLAVAALSEILFTVAEYAASSVLSE